MAYVARNEPPNIDPLIGTGTLFGFVKGVYPGVLQFDPFENDKIITDLAERWEMTPDAKAVTFYLRSGVKWHDGAPFTAEDVKYTFDRPRDPNDPRAIDFATRRTQLNMVDRVEVVDDRTVKVYMKYPTNSFLSWIASGPWGIVPKHAYDEIVKAKSIAVGTGPFTLKEYKQGVVMSLAKNPNSFLKDRPYLDGINYYMLKDDSTKLAAFQIGQVKLLREVNDHNQITQVQTDMPQAVVSKNNALRYGIIAMNNQRPPFTDARVRRAFDLALDRPTSIQLLLGGDGTMGGIIAPGSEWAIAADELAKRPGYRAEKAQDIAEAKRLLTEAGYPNGFKTSILLSSLSNYQALAVLAKDQLAKIGVDLSLIVTTAGDPRSANSDFDMEVRVAALQFADPAGGLTYYGPTNTFLFRDDTFHGLLLKQDQTVDPAERKKLVRQMQDRFFELAPFSVIYWENHASIMWPEVRNLKEGLGVFSNYGMRDVWLAK